MDRFEDSEFYSDKFPDRKAAVDKLMEQFNASTDDGKKLAIASLIKSILRGRWE